MLGWDNALDEASNFVKVQPWEWGQSSYLPLSKKVNTLLSQKCQTTPLIKMVTEHETNWVNLCQRGVVRLWVDEYWPEEGRLLSSSGPRRSPLHPHRHTRSRTGPPHPPPPSRCSTQPQNVLLTSRDITLLFDPQFHCEQLMDFTPHDRFIQKQAQFHFFFFFTKVDLKAIELWRTENLVSQGQNLIQGCERVSETHTQV